MKKSILLIKGNSKYGSTRCFIDELEKAYIKLGVNVLIIDFLDSQKALHILKEVTNNIEFCICFNFAGYKFLRSFFTGTVYVWLVDNPVYHHKKLCNISGITNILCVDKMHVNMVEKYYENVNKVFFLPLAGIRGKNYNIPYSERDYNVVFFASFRNRKIALEHLENLLPQEKKEADELLDLMKQNNFSIEQAYETLLCKKNISLEKSEFVERLSKYKYMDMLLRGDIRDELICGLTRNNVKVDIFGDGWEQYEDYSNKLLTFHGEVSQLESIEIMGNSKIVLNSMPWFKDGSHDRIYSAMLNKCLAITDPSKYLEANFNDEIELLFYTLGNYDDLAKKIKYYLQYETETKSIINSGYRIAIEKETWTQRAKEIIDSYKMDCKKEKL